MCKNHCKNCGKETKNPSYCSKSCSAIATNKLSPKRKITKKCSKCNNLVRNCKSTLCEAHFKEQTFTKKEDILNTTLESYSSRVCITNLHASSKFAHIRGLARSWFRDLSKLPCANCGYDNHVELCHIKPISSFPDTATVREVNNIDNIIQLCPNCHWEFDNGKLHLDFPDQLKSQ